LHNVQIWQGKFFKEGFLQMEIVEQMDILKPRPHEHDEYP
jgi:hypothetical protein